MAQQPGDAVGVGEGTTPGLPAIGDDFDGLAEGVPLVIDGLEANAVPKEVVRRVADSSCSRPA
jgi:hypothetical protein